MMVVFVSQCEKNALKKTRRVLDAFANRIGDNTWQTVITQEGLIAVRKLLRKTASKSTAVSCHWIRSRARSEFLWVVGRKDRFNGQGIVPVNRTEKALLVKEQFSLNTEVIANLAAIAGFFHDVGKANKLFQMKLGVLPNTRNSDASNTQQEKKSYEPLRHEWISLRLFQAFVRERDDEQWLETLRKIDNTTVGQVTNSLAQYQQFTSDTNPLTTLPPIAKIVAWLIVSHHKLPQLPKNFPNQPSLEAIDQWQTIFDPCWNSPQWVNKEWSNSEIEDNWQFPLGTPFNSAYWQTNVSAAADRALKCQRLLSDEWQANLFTQHLARLALMLADHAESARKDVTNNNSDRNYLAFANTDDDGDGKRFLKQKLDEHNINVGELAYTIACSLPDLKSNLKTLGRIKALEKPVDKKDEPEFGWQDKAIKLTRSIKDNTKDYGFFGISMASTGKGKTRANAKIMYALSDEGECRFNVALGLRTLSIQTANALRSDLFGNDQKSRQQANDNVALLVGSQAVRDLQQIDLTKANNQPASDAELKGSESAEPLIKGDIDLLGSLTSGELEALPWLKHDPKIMRLLNAPILVSTIDYLIPATEGIRGGRQIAPMLRLLGSDLVIDEPDDFHGDDLHALCRLVNWAGMLGSKVLISTATILPCEAEALFEAYQRGRHEFTQANGVNGEQRQVCCAWFDECNTPRTELVSSKDEFAQQHGSFVTARDIELVKRDLRLRQAALVNIDSHPDSSPSKDMACRIHQSIAELHRHHAVDLAGKNVSIGLVRMANIAPLVQVAKHLFNYDAATNTCIHYCIYHGQYPLLQRSSIEQMLDKALKRHDFSDWAKGSGLREIIEKSDVQNHIFVVLATSVAEVGRDHDYDWAVVEPSSMRSIIQLAGRVQRHRKNTPDTHNIHVLSKNYKSLKNSNATAKKGLYFVKPGFETERVQYAGRDLFDLNIQDEIESVSARARILKPANPELSNDTPRRFKRFAQLEHIAQLINLFGNKNQASYSARWWQHDVTWCGQLQAMQPFRQALRSKDYAFGYSQRADRYFWQEKQDEAPYRNTYMKTSDIQTPKEPVALARGNYLWHEFDLAKEIEHLSQKIGKNRDEILTTYTHVSLQEYDKDGVETWLYQTEFGIYKLLSKDDYKK